MKKRNHVWSVFAGCMLYYGALMGVLTNCTGVLITKVMETEGFSSSSLSPYYILRNSSLYLAMVFAAWLLKNVRMKPLIIGVGIVASSSFFLMSVFTRPWQWCIAGLLSGLASSMAMLLASVVMKEWFVKKRGTFMGLVTMISGLSAALLNPIVSRVLDLIGWRNTARCMGGLGLLLLVAAALLIVRRPADVGEKPYGWEEGAEEDQPAPAVRSSGRVPFRIREYLFLLFTAATLGIGVQMTSYLPQYAASYSYPLMVGATLTSVNMVGNMSAKLLYGVLSDIVGVWRCSQIFYSINLCGFVILILFGRSLPLVYAASLFIGFAYGSGMAQSLSCMELMPADEYESHYSRLNMLGGLINLPMPYLASYFYDSTGKFDTVLMIFAAIALLGILLIMFRKPLLKSESMKG